MRLQKWHFAALVWGGIVAGFSSSAMAGFAGLKVEAAIGGWIPSFSGDLRYQGDTLDDSRLGLGNSDSEIMARIKIEHPLPLIPDLALHFSPLTLKGTASGSTFQFGNQPFNAGGHATELQLDTMDLTLYYHLPLLETASLDTFDLRGGLTVRRVEGFVSVIQDSDSFQSSTDFSTYMPMVYAGVTVAPMDWLSLSLDVNGIALGGHHWYDTSVEARYSFLSNWAFLGVGYRMQNLVLDDLDSVNADITVSGPFAELGIKF